MNTPQVMRDRSKGLPVGARVWKIGSEMGAVARFGVVKPSQREYSQYGSDSFPVRFDNQLWEMLDTFYVTPVTREEEAEIRGTRPASRRPARQAS